MKQECPTYFKIIGKSKVLAATLSETESKDDFDYEDNEILYQKPIQEVYEEYQHERI